MGIEDYGLDSEKLAGLLKKSMDPIKAAEIMNVPLFAEYLREGPEKAIDTFTAVYYKMVEEAYKKCGVKQYLSWVGGPHPFIIVSLTNAIGEAYPSLSNNIKIRSLNQIMAIFDDNRNDIVTNQYMAQIREPLLITDLAIAFPNYWPFQVANSTRKNLEKCYPSFNDFQEELNPEGLFRHETVRSDFILAIGLLRNEKFGEPYLKVVNPTFLERVLQGISKLEFYFIDQENASAIQARKNKISALFPSMIHDRIFNYAQKRGWIDRREVSSIDSKFYINQDFLIDEDYIRGR